MRAHAAVFPYFLTHVLLLLTHKCVPSLCPMTLRLGPFPCLALPAPTYIMCTLKLHGPLETGAPARGGTSIGTLNTDCSDPIYILDFLYKWLLDFGLGHTWYLQWVRARLLYFHLLLLEMGPSPRTGFRKITDSFRGV